MGPEEYTDSARAVQGGVRNNTEEDRFGSLRTVEFVVPVEMVLCGQEGWQVASNCALSRTAQRSNDSTFGSDTDAGTSGRAVRRQALWSDARPIRRLRRAVYSREL